MSDPSLQRIERIFHEALERLADERGAFLAEACGDDAELRAEVDRLLSAEAQGFSLLDSAPWKRQHVASEVKVTSDPHACAGARVGRYRLIRQVAAGGMGTVWLGERADGHYEQRVAVKLIKRGMDTDDVLHRFRRERQVLAQLRHPNIARLLDGGATDDGAAVPGHGVRAGTADRRVVRRAEAEHPAAPGGVSEGVRGGALCAREPGRAS